MSLSRTAKRTQPQRAEATIAALLGAAREQFGREGYEATTLDGVCAAAGLTKGALYHHFAGGKLDLFEAVVRELQEGLVAAMSKASTEARGTPRALSATIGAYFDTAVDAHFHRITLQDAPAVFGLARWREIEHGYVLPFIRAGIEALVEDRAMSAGAKDMLSAAIYGACCEATVMIAFAEDPNEAKAQAIEVVVAMLEGLARDRRSEAVSAPAPLRSGTSARTGPAPGASG